MNTHNNNKKRRIKLSRRALDLLIELRKYESAENMQMIAGDLNRISSKLVRLYRTTESLRSRGVIAELLAEMGYPWFKKFAREMITGNLNTDHAKPKQNAPQESPADSIKISAKKSTVRHSLQSPMLNVVSKGDFLEMEPGTTLYN